MKEICKICGTEKVEGKCPNAELHLKKMCLNCTSCNFADDYFCQNEENMHDAVDKILANVPSGYAIEEIKLKPLPLKDATKKCARWSLETNTIIDELNALV